MNKPSEVVQRIAEICVDTFYHSDEMDLEKNKIIMQQRIAHLLLDNEWQLIPAQNISRFTSRLDIVERQLQTLKREFNLHSAHE